MATKLHKNITGTDLHEPKAHDTSHEDGGSDEISVTGLSGLLADLQNPSLYSDDNKPTALVGALMDLLWQLPGIINTLENKITILGQEAKRSNTYFDLNDIF